jgi:hypothetical protein
MNEDYDPYDECDLTSEIEEERQERHDRECARRDWEQGIRPNWGDDDKEEGGDEG